MRDIETLTAKIKPEVTYSILVRREEDGPEGHFASGDDKEDAETCRKIRKDAESSEWAWCAVEVRAEWNDLTGSDFLGGCSYASEKDFKEGGYFEDMKDRALDELVAKVAKVQVSE